MDISIPDTVQFELPGYMTIGEEGNHVWITPVDVCLKHAIRAVMNDPDQSVETRLTSEYPRCERCK